MPQHELIPVKANAFSCFILETTLGLREGTDEARLKTSE